MLHTADGVAIAADVAVPPDARAIAVLCHPHPSFGGDRHAIVIEPLFRELPSLGFGAVRFDFRGAGESGGVHGGGAEEVQDVIAAVDAAVARAGGAPIAVVGYSFGGAVALAADDDRIAGWVAIAPTPPPVDGSRPAARDDRPVIVLLPEHDQYNPVVTATAAFAGWRATTVREIAGTDHFLAGAAGRVVDEVSRFLDGLRPAER
jgi:alpha/beta superfamily hydrolase